MTEPMPRSFYARETRAVAKELLGKYLVRQTSEVNIVARIVEVEAYLGADDPASHAYKGLTERNWPMFGEPGCAYVCFIYGNHYCLNVTTERVGVPGAVLIRAVEIVDGLELARKNRKVRSNIDLSNGPSKLTKALNITRIHNGLDLTKTNDLFICQPKIIETFEIATSRKIGIKILTVTVESSKARIRMADLLLNCWSATLQSIHAIAAV
jgi:DNA-3-methyladenine glycosylase